MNPLISNLLMQPKPTNAVERPQTLIEKLEQERGYYLQEYQSCLDSHDVVNAIDSCIDIVKQHSDWVSVDERLPGDRGYFLVRLNTGEITVDYYDYDNSYWSKNYGNVTHFMRLPQPPSEVQDGK